MFQQEEERLQQQQVPYHHKSFSLTHITYPSEDDAIIGPTLALLSLLPPFAIVALTSSTLLYKDVTAGYLLVGSLLCALSTSILKNLIQQPRPSRYDDIMRSSEEEKEEYGMPSNHSSFAFFGATFIILYIWRGCGTKVWSGRRSALLSSYHKSQKNTLSGTTAVGRKKCVNDKDTTNKTRTSFFFKLLVRFWYHLHTTITILISFVLAIGCAYSRIYLGYHTSNQVYVGSILGTILGLLWYRLFETTIVQRSLIWLESLIDELEIARIRAVCTDDDMSAQQEVTEEKSLKHQMRMRTSNQNLKSNTNCSPNQNEEDKPPSKSFRELMMERKKMNQNNRPIIPSPITGITTDQDEKKKKKIDTLDELIMTNCALYLTGSPTEYITWLRTELNVNTISDLAMVATASPEVLVNGNGNVGMWQKKKFCEAVLNANNSVVSVATRSQELKKKD